MSVDQITDSNERMWQRKEQALLDALEHKEKERAEAVRKAESLESFHSARVYLDMWSIMSALAVFCALVACGACQFYQHRWPWEQYTLEAEREGWQRGYDAAKKIWAPRPEKAEGHELPCGWGYFNADGTLTIKDCEPTSSTTTTLESTPTVSLEQAYPRARRVRR